MSAVIFAVVVCQIALSFAPATWAGEKAKTKAENRAASVRAVVSYLGLGEGSVIADIGDNLSLIHI